MSPDERSMLDEVVTWLFDQSFPYDWSSTVPAPVCLRQPLAEKYAAYEADNGEPVEIEDSLWSLDLEQRWTDDGTLA